MTHYCSAVARQNAVFYDRDYCSAWKQNTVFYVLQLLGCRMQYSIFQSLQEASDQPALTARPFTLSPKGLPHPNPKHNLEKILILFRKVIENFVFLHPLQWVSKRGNQTKVGHFWNFEETISLQRRDIKATCLREESKKYTGNTKEGFTTNVTCRVLQPLFSLLSPKSAFLSSWAHPFTSEQNSIQILESDYHLPSDDKTFSSNFCPN